MSGHFTTINKFKLKKNLKSQSTLALSAGSPQYLGKKSAFEGQEDSMGHIAKRLFQFFNEE